MQKRRMEELGGEVIELEDVLCQMCVWYVWCMMYGMYDVWCVWCTVYGVYGVWCMVYGVWCMVCMVYGVWCMVYGVRTLSQVRYAPAG